MLRRSARGRSKDLGISDGAKSLRNTSATATHAPDSCFMTSTTLAGRFKKRAGTRRAWEIGGSNRNMSAVEATVKIHCRVSGARPKMAGYAA